MSDWSEIVRHIGDASGTRFAPDSPGHIGGGCINRAMRLSDGRQSYFVKLNRAGLAAMFEAELEGLQALANTDTLRVPRPVCCGTTGNQAYLVLEHIDFGPAGDEVLAGRQLAALHGNVQERFGWHRDNTIGSSPQPNRLHNDWSDFWRSQRLGHQLRLAADQGHSGRLLERGNLLLELFPALFDHHPRPSLLHGDLWGGNLSYDRRGRPVIFDPACYFGDREADLAMTELFGGFSRRFYAAYNEIWPLAPGYPARRILYNLYHILNHLNLFGGGYGGQALRMTDQLLAELGH